MHRRTIGRLRISAGRWAASLYFAFHHRRLRPQPKILYALTPQPSLANVGDHAQAVAIRRWLAAHFPALPVVEVDKPDTVRLLAGLRWLVREEDLIVLHSGGNLGDRGVMSENARRAVIRRFPRNRIVSLPQTIFFSDTDRGRREREVTRKIYGRHPALTIIGRDPVSGALAAELFPNAQTWAMPDFVLSLPGRPGLPGQRVLLCLRNDDESVLTSEDRRCLEESVPYETDVYDTTLDVPIARAQRETILEETLDLFAAARAVVTDRYHGLIFSVLCSRPTVVLPTVDHKLTSAMAWFEGLPFVTFVRDVSEVPAALERVLLAADFSTPDWNATYFDELARRMGETSAP